MAEEYGLHELAVEDARKGHQRPKIEEYGDSLFAVLQTVDPDPENPDAPRATHDQQASPPMPPACSTYSAASCADCRRPTSSSSSLATWPSRHRANRSRSIASPARRSLRSAISRRRKLISPLVSSVS